MKNDIKIDRVLQSRSGTHGDFALQGHLSQMLKRQVDSSISASNTKNCKPAHHYCNLPQIEAIHMILHKIARIVEGDASFEDHWVDIIGYATLALTHRRTEFTETDVEDLTEVYND